MNAPARLVAAVFALTTAACQPPTEAPAPPQAPAAPTPPAPTADSGVRLQATGLTLHNAGGGSSQTVQVPFGMAEASAVQMVAAVRGRPPTRDRNTECGAGPLDFADWGDGLSFVFQGGRFAGWWASDQAPATYAAEGDIHVGSTLAQVRAALPSVQVREDTIGPEFAAGELYGTLSGMDDAARVTALWAGVSCVFR